MLLLNQPVKVDEQLANALLLIAPRSDLVDMIRVSPKIHQTLQHVLKSSIASITNPRLSYYLLILLSNKMWSHLPH